MLPVMVVFMDNENKLVVGFLPVTSSKSEFPNPWLWTGIGLWPVRKWATQKEMSGWGVREASSVFVAASQS